MATIHPLLEFTSVGLSSIFILFGTIGNVYLFCRQIRKPFNADPTFILLAFIRVADLISLYGCNLKYILKPFLRIDNETYSLLSCKLTSFSQFFGLKLHAWILVSDLIIEILSFFDKLLIIFFKVSIMFERYFSINVRNWRELHINKIKTLSVAFLLVFIICIIEMPITVINGYTEDINGTEYVRCLQSKQFPFIPIWQQVRFYFSFSIEFYDKIDFKINL